MHGRVGAGVVWGRVGTLASPIAGASTWPPILGRTLVNCVDLVHNQETISGIRSIIRYSPFVMHDLTRRYNRYKCDKPNWKYTVYRVDFRRINEDWDSWYTI